MANMVDYLQWRGDIPFSVDPFNEVDNLILSELVYIDFTGIVPPLGSKEAVSISKACNQFFTMHAEDELMDRVSSTKVAPFLMQDLIQSKRFSGMRLTGYVDEIDHEFQSQFAAVTYLLEDGTAFVAYRGTDNTIVGWKEDFNMSFLYQTHGQMRAAEYLTTQGGMMRRKLRVGGHSKGGNFAVYASAFCDKRIKNRILEVYSNDGPGFCSTIMSSEDYQEILPKVKSTIPESSIVGLLLENELEHKVVKSSLLGAMQHDLMSWEVLGNHYVLADGISESSMKLDKTLKSWVYSLEPSEREVFVNTLFYALSATGATTLDELKTGKLEVFNEVTKTLTGLTPEKQKAFKDVFSHLGRAIRKTNSKNEKKREIKRIDEQETEKL